MSYFQFNFYTVQVFIMTKKLTMVYACTYTHSHVDTHSHTRDRTHTHTRTYSQTHNTHTTHIHIQHISSYAHTHKRTQKYTQPVCNIFAFMCRSNMLNALENPCMGNPSFY